MPEALKVLRLPPYSTVQITCALTGFRVADGNTWWYQIASSPWNNSYSSADAFYNEPGVTSGSLLGTPFVDPNVPICGEGGVKNEYRWPDKHLDRLRRCRRYTGSDNRR